MNKVRLALYLGILVHLIGCSSFHSEKIDLLAQVPSDCPILYHINHLKLPIL